MKRRGFLGALAGAIAAAKLLGEKVVEEHPVEAKRVAESLVEPPVFPSEKFYPRTMTFTL